MRESASAINDDQSILPVHLDTESRMECIRKMVYEYQFQSPGHYELDIKVEQTSTLYDRSEREKARSLTRFVDVLFCGISIEGRIAGPARCHIRRLEPHSMESRWQCVAVSQCMNVQKPNVFLASTFPVINGPLRANTLWRWWLDNGKTFNWTALPTELKEQIVAHCLHQPHTYGNYVGKLDRFNRRYQASHKICKPGPFEVVDQLGDWFPLLYVSHQVRAITLRLCIVGGSNLTHSKGLCLVTSSYNSLRERIDRLGQYYQMTSPSSIPTSPAEEALSRTYDRFPKMYPQLARYATLRHGIQNVSISMDFLSFMQFFKVTVGGFGHYHNSKALSYDVFERLPSLNEIVIRLPLRPNGGWRHRPQGGGPQLWHEDSPCPRMLHRVIYERIAEVMPMYKVTVRNFLDEHEEQRYEARRLQALNALKVTQHELEELYAETDEDGGVPLSEAENLRSIEMEKVQSTEMEGENGARPPVEGFFPPICHCDEPCMWCPVLLTRFEHS